jgi:hypothetical protein
VYGVLLLPFHGEPSLVTAFASRRDFLKAMGLEDCPRDWAAARKYERAVYEMTSPAEVEAVMREVSAEFPDSFEACAIRLAEWVESAAEEPRSEASVGIK